MRSITGTARGAHSAASCLASSVDGCTRIVYSHRTSAGDPTPEIYVMGGDGSNKKKLADGDRPTWSRDHVKIAFTKANGNNNYDIFWRNAVPPHDQ